MARKSVGKPAVVSVDGSRVLPDLDSVRALFGRRYHRVYARPLTCEGLEGLAQVEDVISVEDITSAMGGRYLSASCMVHFKHDPRYHQVQRTLVLRW